MAARKKNVNEKHIGDIELSPALAQDQQDAKDARSLRERAMLVRSTVSRWYGTGADDEVIKDLAHRNEAKGVIGTFTKRFMSRDRLLKINQITADARRYHKQKTLPWGDSGSRLLSVQTFFAYKKQMASYERDFYIAVEEFLADYPKSVLDEKHRLGKLWRASDYPTVDQMRQRFKFSVLVEPLPSSEDFRLALSKEDAEEVKREYDAQMRSWLKGAVHDVFARAEEAVKELQEKLADPNAKLRASSFEGLRKLVAALPELNNMLQDPQIAALGKSIAADLLNVNLDSVKHDKATRSEAKRKADKILDALKPLQHSWGQQQPSQE